MAGWYDSKAWLEAMYKHKKTKFLSQKRLLQI